MELDNKRILVIGGAGLIGSHVVDELIKTNVGEILIYDNMFRGNPDNLEDALGPWKFLTVYLFCGVIAALTELLACYLVDRDLLMVGASGAVAGLFGMYLLWFRHASLTFMFIVWQKKLNPAWYFAIWAAMNIIGLLSEDLSVAYWAHLGGLVAGLAVGLALKQKVMAKNPMLQLLQRPEAKILR